ncbi:RNA polymerase sigma factor [Dyadobacter psychrotolerans]|uniref:Sigma-70 family RNA polymerase sigma factor n=1 Tax=Dyadobacter psychrotolerans TaxID=2541721 RepID=A0A4R5DS33_9BACT|nr:sigma-70 family RNA polymerase sigma factor [Dyadobacter psychrotolerans]TDE17139.1 sigma-70 family RNA polymerase sigma factor [Dyadobacter psychrotolerans]
MIHDSQHDTQIWDAFRLGDKNAYAQVYELYFDSLYSYGKKFMSDPTRVEDAIQDLFITLWRTREKLSAVDNIKFYLFRSLRRDIHRISEKENVFNKVDFDSFLDSHNHPAEEYGSTDSDRELTQKLVAILKELPRRQLESITLRYYENFSIAEIASIMDVSEKTVRNTLHNSLTLLRKNSNMLYTFLKLTLMLWH